MTINSLNILTFSITVCGFLGRLVHTLHHCQHRLPLHNLSWVLILFLHLLPVQYRFLFFFPIPHFLEQVLQDSHSPHPESCSCSRYTGDPLALFGCFELTSVRQNLPLYPLVATTDLKSLTKSSLLHLDQTLLNSP